MVLTLIIYLAILGYLAISYRFFTEWLEFFLEDEEMKSGEQRFFHGVLLIIASILWPIVVPLAYLELLKFHKKHKEMINFLINLYISNPYRD